MKYNFNNLKNSFDFFLRQKLKLSRKNYSEKNEDKVGLFTIQYLIEREEQIVQKYNLADLKSNSTCQNYLENLYITDLLDKYFKIDSADNLSVLDIGCKNWFYAKGEHSFFEMHSSSLKFDGIELDTNRLYSNFFSRGEVAKFYIKDLKGANYIEGDFLNHSDKYDHIVWILPFVVEFPLIKWGLPDGYFQPERMLKHAHESLKQGGKIFIINQGEIEYEIQKSLCEKLSIAYTPLNEVESDFYTYKIPRYGMLIEK